MSANKKQSPKKDFDIQKEIEFWNAYEFSKDSDSKLIERFKKIRNENISKENAKIISDNMGRIIPSDKQPAFFLKIFLELPKRECEISKELTGTIKNICNAFFEKNNIDITYISSVGKEICSSEKPEEIIAEFINRIRTHVRGEGYKEADILALVYIWLVLSCKEYRIQEHWKTTAIIEKVFVELLRTDKEKDIKDCALKSVPRAIANGTYKKQFLSLSYL